MAAKKKAHKVKHKTTKKVTKKAAPKKKEMIMAKAAKPAKKVVGVVTHYFDKISVAVIEVKTELKVGDMISIEGPQTNLKQKISSMQVERRPIAIAKKGDDVGMKVTGTVRNKDLVYKV